MASMLTLIFEKSIVYIEVNSRQHLGAWRPGISTKLINGKVEKYSIRSLLLKTLPDFYKASLDINTLLGVKSSGPKWMAMRTMSSTGQVSIIIGALVDMEAGAYLGLAQQRRHPLRGTWENTPWGVSRIASGREIPEGSWGIWRIRQICLHEILKENEFLWSICQIPPFGMTKLTENLIFWE